MERLLLKELEKEILRLKVIRGKFGEKNLCNEYLDGQIDAIAKIIDLMHLLEMK